MRMNVWMMMRCCWSHSRFRRCSGCSGRCWRRRLWLRGWIIWRDGWRENRIWRIRRKWKGRKERLERWALWFCSCLCRSCWCWSRWQGPRERPRERRKWMGIVRKRKCWGGSLTRSSCGSWCCCCDWKRGRKVGMKRGKEGVLWNLGHVWFRCWFLCRCSGCWRVHGVRHVRWKEIRMCSRMLDRGHLGVLRCRGMRLSRGSGCYGFGAQERDWDSLPSHWQHIISSLEGGQKNLVNKKKGITFRYASKISIKHLSSYSAGTIIQDWL